MDESKQILVSLGRLEENFKNMNAKIDNLSKVSELAFQTDQSVRSAHNRLDDLKTDFDEKIKKQKEDYEEKFATRDKSFDKMDGNITWLWRTVGGGVIGLAFSIILFFIQRFS